MEYIKNTFFMKWNWPDIWLKTIGVVVKHRFIIWSDVDIVLFFRCWRLSFPLSEIMKFHKLLQPFCSGFTSHIRCRKFGQPAAQTHPHLLKEGEVTPGISKQEYKRRRSKLVSLAETSLRRANVNTSESLFIFPTAPKLYMTADIPYPYHQNTDFLYLCGFLEPCSVLVMTSQAGKASDNHRSVLFVQKKDPHKELWDGPRSGLDGSLFLTGVDKTHSMDELENYLYQFCKSNSQYSVFYNYMKPTDMEVHTNVISKFLQQRPLCYKDTGIKLIQQLKVIKSEAEISLMQTSVDIACEAFVDVMRFSHPRVSYVHYRNLWSILMCLIICFMIKNDAILIERECWSLSSFFLISQICRFAYTFEHHQTFRAFIIPDTLEMFSIFQCLLKQ